MIPWQIIIFQNKFVYVCALFRWLRLYGIEQYAIYKILFGFLLEIWMNMGVISSLNTISISVRCQIKITLILLLLTQTRFTFFEGCNLM